MLLGFSGAEQFLTNANHIVRSHGMSHHLCAWMHSYFNLCEHMHTYVWNRS